jgi:hypothetical protein
MAKKQKTYDLSSLNDEKAKELADIETKVRKVPSPLNSEKCCTRVNASLGTGISAPG